MKHLKKILLLSSVFSILFSSCAVIFIPSKQKIAVTTNNEKSEVYADGEMIGEGKQFQTKISKVTTAPEIVVKTPGHKENYYALLKTRRPSSFVPLHILSWLCYALPGLYEFAIIDAFDKLTAYDKQVSFEAGPKLVYRTENDKYINISNIKVNILDKNRDMRDIALAYRTTDLLKIMAEKEKEDEAEYIKAKVRADAQKAKAEKKGKVKKKLVEEDNTVKFDDTKHSYQIFKTLKETGFIDTVNTVFHDQSNTLVLEGSIDKVKVFRVYTKHSSQYFKSKIYLTWYIKNMYNEIIDSIATTEFSGDFLRVYNRYDNQYSQYLKMIGDAIDISYMKLHQNPTFLKHSKINKDFEIKENILTLKSPSSSAVISDKSDAAGASVIVKRKLNGKDDGHGSGFAITQDGYIITNYHIVAGKTEGDSPEIRIITPTGKEVPAKLIRRNKFRDVALLKADLDFEKVFKVNNTKNFKNMLDVYTIGAPKSIELGQSVSSGIISNLREYNDNPAIQLGMALNFGNSGGPLFDGEGNLHGVIRSKLTGYSTEGVGFAVPSYLLNEYLKIEFK